MESAFKFISLRPSMLLKCFDIIQHSIEFAKVISKYFATSGGQHVNFRWFRSVLMQPVIFNGFRNWILWDVRSGRIWAWRYNLPCPLWKCVSYRKGWGEVIGLRGWNHRPYHPTKQCLSSCSSPCKDLESSGGIHAAAAIASPMQVMCEYSPTARTWKVGLDKTYPSGFHQQRAYCCVRNWATGARWKTYVLAEICVWSDWSEGSGDVSCGDLSVEVSSTWDTDMLSLTLCLSPWMLFWIEW